MRLVRAALVLFGAAILLPAIPPVPRPAPDFEVRFTDGTKLPLRFFRGKVVALTFIATTCPHCQHDSQVLTNLYAEYGSRGFQPVAVAFNPMANLYVQDFVKDFGIKHPVGFSPVEPVLAFLGISTMERYVYPQIVWIDRKGIIRSQTPALGDDTKMLQEPYWREMIEKLIKEPAEGANAAKKPATRSAQAKKTP
jgi:peroxiredoxin